jgi:hypothetical protein
MVTGLERHVHRRATRLLSSGLQRERLSVGFAIPRVKALADDDTVTNDNSADHRVRRCLTPALLGEGKRATHELRVAGVVRIRIELRPIRRVLNRLVVCH